MVAGSLCMKQSLGLCNRAELGRVRPDQSLTLSLSPCFIGTFEDSENFNLNMCFQVIMKVSFFLGRMIEHLLCNSMLFWFIIFKYL